MKKQFFSLLIVPFLVACSQPDYSVEVDLDASEVAEVQSSIEKQQAEIESYDALEDNAVPDVEIVKLAHYYEDLGDISGAIQVYKDAIKTGNDGEVILNNLAVLYDSVEEYKKAVDTYDLLIEERGLNQYIEQVAKIYYKLEDKEHFDEYNQMWIDAYGRTNPMLKQLSELLKKNEDASES